MSEKPSVVFVVVGRGHTVSSILGTFVDENKANEIKIANEELWVSTHIEPWVLDYEAPNESVDKAIVGKKIVAQEEYNVGDQVLFDDGHVKGFGIIESKVYTGPDRRLSNLVYHIDCEPGNLVVISTGWSSENAEEAAMYHSEIKGAAK